MKKLLLLTVTIMAVSIASAQIINVPGDYPTIQEGINAATTGDVVLVAEGTYYENINFKGKAITVASLYWDDGDTNHINNTIIDGSQPVYPDSASVVSFRNGEDTTSIISGFTITGGTGTIMSPFLSRDGGGINLEESGAKIIHNKIIGNSLNHTSFSGGGGIMVYCKDEEYWTVIAHNTISQNTINTVHSSMGGGIYAGASCKIYQNKIAENLVVCTGPDKEAEGGGIYCAATGEQDFVAINDNIISSNTLASYFCRGAAIQVYNSQASIINNQIYKNETTEERASGSAMGFLYINGDVLIQGNQITENIHNVDTMGVSVITLRNVLNQDVTIKILNNTIAYNENHADNAWIAPIWLWDLGTTEVVIDGNYIHDHTTGDRAGGFYARDSYNFHLTNNVFSGNSADESGGVIYLHQYTPGNDTNRIRSVIANNTFIGNSAAWYGGAIYLTSMYDSICPLIMNNIFYYNNANTGNDIYYQGSEPMNIYNNNILTSQIFGPWDGHNNINENPLFIDDTCHIDCITPSPCWNAGIGELELNGTTFFAPDHDFDGDPRPLDEGFDIGADEALFCDAIPEENISQSEQTLWVHPNPCSGALHLRYQISDIRYQILEVFSTDGMKVKTLFAGEQQAGEHELDIDLRDLPNGIYLIRLLAGKQIETAKIILLK